jgi:hypothetical protein
MGSSFYVILNAIHLLLYIISYAFFKTKPVAETLKSGFFPAVVL